MTLNSGPIVHIVQHLVPGGLEVMVLELARAQSHHHKVLVISLEGDEARAKAAWPHLARETTPLMFLGKRPGLDLGLPLRLARVLRNVGAIGIHTHHIGPLLYSGLAARLHRNLRRIHTEHDAWHLKNRKRRILARFATEFANPILVADAPHVADAVVEAFGEAHRPLVILNGVDTDRFAPGDGVAARRALGLPERGSIIGIAARLEKVKGVDIALEALSLLPDVKLAIAGSGSERENLRQITEKLHISDRVIWLGHVDDTALLYQAVDAVCLPSRAEGLPLALLEAQSCGRVVVASRVGGVPAAIDPHSGVLVPSEDPAALADGIRSALARSLLLSLCQDDTLRPGSGDPRGFVIRTASLDAMETAYTNLMIGDAL